MLERLKSWAAALKREALVLWFGSRDPRTPWYAKWLAVFIVAYALSPIDLIPDFIPVIGLLDEIILLPVFIWLTLKLVPAPVIAECRTRAQEWLAALKPKPRNYVAAAVIVVLWIVAAWLLWRWLAN